MESRRQFLRRGALGATLAALGGLAGCLDDGTPGETDEKGDGQVEKDYTAWLYDPAEFFDPDVTMFTSVDVARAKTLFEEELDGEYGQFDEEVEQLEDLDGLEEYDRATAIAFGTAEMDAGAFGGGIALTGTFDVEALVDELESKEDFSEDDVERETYEGYEVYAFEEDGMRGGMALRDDAVLFGAIQGTDAEPAAAVTTLIDEHASADSSYYDASDDAAAIVDALESDGLSVSGVELDPTALGLDGGSGRIEGQMIGDLAAVGSATDVTDDDRVTADVVLRYESEDAADADAVESLIDTMLMDAPDVDADDFEELSVTGDGRQVQISLAFDPEAVATDAAAVDPAALLLVGAFPVPAVVGAFVLDLGQSASPTPQVGVTIDEATPEEVSVTVTSVANADDVRIVVFGASGVTEIDDLEATAGSTVTLSAADGDYEPGDTIQVIAERDGTEVVVATHDTSR